MFASANGRCSSYFGDCWHMLALNTNTTWLNLLGFRIPRSYSYQRTFLSGAIVRPISSIMPFTRSRFVCIIVHHFETVEYLFHSKTYHFIGTELVIIIDCTSRCDTSKPTWSSVLVDDCARARQVSPTAVSYFVAHLGEHHGSFCSARRDERRPVASLWTWQRSASRTSRHLFL
jgi:hypothetical protein